MVSIIEVTKHKMENSNTLVPFPFLLGNLAVHETKAKNNSLEQSYRTHELIGEHHIHNIAVNCKA